MLGGVYIASIVFPPTLSTNSLQRARAKSAFFRPALSLFFTLKAVSSVFATLAKSTICVSPPAHGLHPLPDVRHHSSPHCSGGVILFSRLIDRLAVIVGIDRLAVIVGIDRLAVIIGMS